MWPRSSKRNASFHPARLSLPRGDRCVRVGLGDVEDQMSEHGQIGRPIVLATAGEILVEGNIEQPMQAIIGAQ